MIGSGLMYDRCSCFWYQIGQLNVSVPLSSTTAIREEESLATHGHLSVTDRSLQSAWAFFVATVHQSALFSLIETFLQWHTSIQRK